MFSNLNRNGASPYVAFNRTEWSRLRNSTPMTISEDELKIIRGINEMVSSVEVEEVYLAISRLLKLYFDASSQLFRARKTFLSEDVDRVPYVIGIAGSVAVGKSTTGRLLKTLLSRWPERPKVDLVATDGFLYPNSILREKGIMERKGFPESYDLRALIRFLYDIKSGKPEIKIPVYSHLIYDIVPGRYEMVDKPDILILEGLNVLQTRHTIPRSVIAPELLVSDFFDFSIYVDALEQDIKQWYIDRFLVFRETAFRDPNSFFRKYGDLDVEEAKRTASEIWDRINGVNLRENIEPTKYHADLILKKAADHSVTNVYMRRI
ncbi:MAG: type I pantothenate kinase [Candidatus Thermoplasmatota archaeon]|jgi:type I pantothenate kinase|nr:type I pantothenate kinase [Candidatus Thermoplasmatota archaeon]